MITYEQSDGRARIDATLSFDGSRLHVRIRPCTGDERFLAEFTAEEVGPLVEFLENLIVEACRVKP